MTKVKPLLGRTGKPVANQYVITDDQGNTYFQSYKSIIAKIPDLHNTVTSAYSSPFSQDINNSHRFQIVLDKTYWNYSITTSKYRNQFLGESTKETQAKINSGEYKLVDLNN